MILNDFDLVFRNYMGAAVLVLTSLELNKFPTAISVVLASSAFYTKKFIIQNIRLMNDIPWKFRKENERNWRN